MPRKVTASAGSVSKKPVSVKTKKVLKNLPEISSAPIMPEMSTPVMETAVATETQVGIGLGVLIVSCLTLIAAFGSMAMAGVITITSSNGAVTCSDTDASLGADDIYTAGSVTLTKAGSYPSTATYKDACMTGADTGKVLERICKTLNVNGQQTVTTASKQALCPNGCDKVKGACIKIAITKPIISNVQLPSSILIASSSVNIAKFNVAADNAGDLSWRRINFKYSLNNASTSLSNCFLRDSNNNSPATAIQMNRLNISIDLPAEQVIVKGTMKTYSLFCAVSGSLRAGDTLTTVIDGTVANSIGAMSYNDLIAAGENRFIWSDMSAASHSLITNDWYGSVNVQGLPSAAWTLTK